ncbi:hypothetical protein FJV80_04335 [Mesorhizobium sp. WSM4310]|uniref:hypothetical protein n=1 Tax=Mesorhizobium sp. WSM4310 TaxID=2589883 RepID=UPI00115E09E4|nr:hypothetical protein [Mesorhizobium sp. WSM4310]TRC91156.1 hypothetical protein FJV80_04335 [Mesorhizobium sp. WSM4310]
MADKNSHTILTQGDPYYAQGKPKDGGMMPIAGEAYRSDLIAMHAADQLRQTEAERIATEVLTLAPGAPEDFAIMVRSYPLVAAYLLPVFLKANGYAEG